ncbi:hypothetical protein C8R45DRAFT_1132607 [Mycena sanguinolenta]|nr:hypothetical protein C8R45DRAFT_1132607 [Mycena sanguinolenta]
MSTLALFLYALLVLPALLIVPKVGARAAPTKLAIDAQHAAQTDVPHCAVAASTVIVGEDQFLSSSESCVGSSDEMAFSAPPLPAPRKRGITSKANTKRGKIARAAALGAVFGTLGLGIGALLLYGCCSGRMQLSRTARFKEKAVREATARATARANAAQSAAPTTGPASDAPVTEHERAHRGVMRQEGEGDVSRGIAAGEEKPKPPSANANAPKLDDSSAGAAGAEDLAKR